MYLTDSEIYEWAEAGGIIPFVYANVNPCSYDICLGDVYIDFLYPDNIIHAIDNTISIYKTSSVYDWLHKKINTPFKKLYGRNLKHLPSVIFAITKETVNIADDMMAEIKLKTSPTRSGLNNSLADLVDPGYFGKLTLMFSAHKTIHLTVGMRIAQLVLCRLDKPVAKSYKETGHYQGQNVPMIAWKGYNEL